MTDSPVRATHGIADIVRNGAIECPGQVALHFRDAAWTFSDLDEIANRVAQSFVSAGLEPGARVGILDRSSHFAVAVILGAAKAGLTYVGLNWRLAGPELAHLVNDAQLDGVFVGPDYAAVLDSLVADGHPIGTVVPLGDDCLPAPEWIAAHQPVDAERSLPEGAPAILLYSSGTTGRPKGIMLGEAGLVGLIKGGARWGFGADGVNLVNLPFFHIGGVGWSLLGLHHRNPGVVVRDAMPADLLGVIEKHGVTNAFLVPTIIHMMINAPEFTTEQVASMRAIVYGGAAASPTLLEQAKARIPAQFIGSYGLTETTNGVTVLLPADVAESARREASVGRPHEGVRVRIIDPVSGKACTTGASGEIQILAAQNMIGYWNLPEATERTLVDGGWLRTGDVGILDEDGFVYVVDRLVDMLISGGENIYPAEIENVLVQHDSVAQAAVVGVPDERWGEVPVAFLVPSGTSEPESAQIEAWCREQLAGYKIPRAFVTTDALPVNATGKVHKDTLRQRYAGDADG